MTQDSDPTAWTSNLKRKLDTKMTFSCCRVKRTLVSKLRLRTKASNSA